MHRFNAKYFNFSIPFDQFQGILKPAYNTIDMLEVELLDDARDPRDFSDTLLKVTLKLLKIFCWIQSRIFTDDSIPCYWNQFI